MQSQTLEGEELLFVVFQRQRFEVDAAQQRVTEMDCQVSAREAKPPKVVSSLRVGPVRNHQ